ncbi:MAG: hypothetical protein P8J79_08715 [Halioglobus sp.]|nr:hypothetical protein [Halioglobus sp.]
MNLNTISRTILDESSSPQALRDALDAFVLLCSEITNIRPDRSFDAWAEDSLLENGVAINPQAAAQCALDYERSVVFLRGIYAAINTLKLRFSDTPLEILYAGCGPFATLLLPLLGLFSPGEIKLYLMDFHQRSLDSVELLLADFGFCKYATRTIKADACSYTHPGKLHLVIAEVMQKSLEQEPQFAVTANLAPQLCSAGVFIPQFIDVSMYLSNLDQEKELLGQAQDIDSDALEKNARRYRLKTVCTLIPDQAAGQMQRAKSSSDELTFELEPITVRLPKISDIGRFDAVLFTRICVFGRYWLKDYESQITLPLKCHELSPLAGGERYRVCYQLGTYPRFVFEHLNRK